MTDLMAKLTAALDEEERIAQAVLDAKDVIQIWLPGSDVAEGVYLGEELGRHVTHQCPDRALRRVAAHRRVLARHYELYRDIGWMEDGAETMDELPVCGYCTPKHAWFKTRAEVPLWPCAEIRDLADQYEIEVTP